MGQIVNQQELICEIQDSVQGLIDFVNGQVKLGIEGSQSGDADTTERGIFSRLLQLGLQLMHLYFTGLGNGDRGKIMDVNGVLYERGPCSPRTLLTVFGIVHFKRYFYYRLDKVKEESLKFLDAQVNIPNDQASYFVVDWLSRLGVKYTVFEEAVRFMKDMFGLSLSKRTAEESVANLSVSYERYEEQRELVENETEGELCVLQGDGKGVPMHKSERPGKGTKKEALVGCVYTVDRHDRSAEAVAKNLILPNLLDPEEEKKLKDRDKAHNIHYRSSLEKSREEVFNELREEVEKRQGERELICLFDGAPVLTRLAKEHFPEAVIILDIIHVLDYLWPAVHAFEKEDSTKAKALACHWLTAILSGKVGYVIGGIRQRLTKRGKKLGSKKKEKVNDAIRLL